MRMRTLPRRSLLVALSLVLAAGCGGSTAHLEPATCPPADHRDPSAEPAPGPAPHLFPSAGIGSLVGLHRSGREEYLHLRRLLVESKLTGDLAETSVEHVFFNPTDERMEGTFRFPLPSAALLIGLALEVNGKLVEGVLVEREKAAKVYQQIVDEMRDPALLEWEQGNAFKLRVFPIEPGQEKRIVLRYLAPLERREGRWRYTYQTSALEGQERIDQFRLRLDGRAVVDAERFRPGQRVDVPVAAPTLAGGVALEERLRGVTYTAVRVKPDWARVARPKGQPPRRLLALVDTSRSALETRPLLLDALRLLLEELSDEEAFLVVASDVACRGHARGFATASPQAIHEALSFIGELEPDGASDLGAGLRCAGKELLKDGTGTGVIVYLGDGIATWGETEEGKLAALARRAVGKASLHALLLGKEVNLELMQRLAGELGGRAVHANGKRQARAFIQALHRSVAQAALRQVRLEAGEGQQLFPRVPTTLFDGDDLLALIRTAEGGALPARLTLSATDPAGQTYRESFPVRRAAATPHVGKRWAALQLAHLEGHGASRDAIVKLSTEHGVMSKHTSFLVLESEEAYKRFAIERQQRRDEGVKWKTPTDARPKVSGADLESVPSSSSRERREAPDSEARLSAASVQPGDPEVVIRAPTDATSVTLVLPTGEVKPCVRGDDGRWRASFLIPKQTAEGIYAIRVLITRATGEQLTRSLRYRVDGTAPRVAVELSPAQARPGAPLTLRVRPLRLEAAPAPLAGELDPTFAATVRQDLQSVQALLPGGETRDLARQADGSFVLSFTAPRRAGRHEVSVVARDHARNGVRHRVVFVVGR